MYADGPNPSKVQAAPSYKRTNPPPPLVLIHDGSGTTFGYFFLGSLYRDVWAIHNPHYFDGRAFEGGVDEMARLYVNLMYDAGLTGPVLLGGWSFGGFLSLAVSHALARDPEAKITVAGIVLMDTPHHLPYDQLDGPTDDPVIDDVPELVQRAFDHCDEMLKTWELPRWDGPAAGGRSVCFGVGGRRYSAAPGRVLHKPFRGTWRTIDTAQHHRDDDGHGAEGKPEKPLEPPPAVLIRCAQPMPLPEGRTEPFLIDKHRGDELLGWQGRYPDFVKAVINVDANHYGMFERSDHEKMKYLTAQLNQSLEILDSIGSAVRAMH